MMAVVWIGIHSKEIEMMRSKRLVISIFMGMSLSLLGQGLEQGFQNPPTSARPFTWWHWMAGNVSKYGIEKDLAAMDQFGIGGFQNFNADLGVAQRLSRIRLP